MKISGKWLLRMLLAVMDAGLFVLAFAFCDWAAEMVRPAVYSLVAPGRPHQPHLASMYYMLIPGVPLYLGILTVVGFYLWEWWTPRRLGVGAIIMAVLMGFGFSAICLTVQRASYPLLHLALLPPVLAVLAWLSRVFLTLLPPFRRYVDRRYPVIRAEAGQQEGEEPGGQDKISLLTVHYQQPEMWAAFERHLLANPPKTPFELILVNNSPEDRLRISAELAPWTTVISLDNPGFAAGINAAYAHAAGNIVGVFNLDVELSGDVIDRAVARLRGNPQAGVLLPRLNNPGGGRQHSVRQFYDWRTAIYARIPLRSFVPTPKFFREYLMADLETAEPMSVDWGLGAAMFIRRESIVGGRVFDPRYFLYFEDVDLCWNMWRRGWQVLYDPELVCVHHHARASAKSPLRPIFFHHIMSFLLFALKHGGLRRPQAEAERKT